MSSSISDTLQLAAGIIGFCAYIPLTWNILKNNASQSFATFLLWGMLDGIATVGTILEDGNFWLPLSNVVGTITIAGILMLKKRVDWSWIETTTSLLVMICIAVWLSAGDKWAIISSSLALIIASMPQMVETYKRPKETPALIYTVWLIANILSFFAGKAWTINERFYAGCGMVLCVSIIVISLTPGHQRKVA